MQRNAEHGALRTAGGASAPRSRHGRSCNGAPVYAAVDLGTHNCRMLMACPDRRLGFRVINSFSKPVRLGEGLEARGSLGDAAVERTIDALRACAQRMRRAQIVRARCIATAPCRRADNASAFVARVKRETNLDLEPLAAAEEARLTLSGCAPLLDRAYPRVLLLDIGGGSTEVSWIAREGRGALRFLGVVSLPVGVVSFAERYGGDRVPAETYQRMVSTIAEMLAPFEAEHAIEDAVSSGRVQMVGTSGTVTTIAAAYLGLTRYERARVDGLSLSFDAIAEVTRRFAASTWQERAANTCIGPHRADLVIAGCAILEAVCKRWRVGRLHVADRGIREGLLMTMMAADGAAPVNLPAVSP